MNVTDPIPANSISVPVHASTIAQAQTAWHATAALGSNYVMEPNPNENHPGEFQLFKRNSKTPIANIKFGIDKNGQDKMTAIFIEPIDKNAIKEVIDRTPQPNLFTTFPKEPSEFNCKFKDKEIEDFAKSTFRETYNTRHNEEKMPIIGVAIALENKTINVLEKQQPSSSKEAPRR